MNSSGDITMWVVPSRVAPRGGGTSWVVVADEAVVRILTTTEGPGTLDPVEAFAGPTAHARKASCT